MALPLLATGIVTGYQEEAHGVYVSLEPSLSGPSYAVKVIEPYSDGVRVQQNALPVRGTWGLVAFPYGDDRNGMWIGAFNPNFVDAINAVAGDAGQYYQSFPSDVYELIDKDGNILVSHPSYSTSSPSGTFLVINQDGQKPTVYRHVVDSATQEQQRIPFPDSQRQKRGAPYVRLHHASGADIQIDPSGNLTASIPGNSNTTITGSQTVTVDGAQTINAKGGTTINVTGDATIDASGSISATAGTTATVTAGTTATVSASTSAAVTAPAVTLGDGTGGVLSLVNSDGVTVYDSHTHQVPGIQTGSSTVTTTTPNNSMASSTTSATKAN